MLIAPTANHALAHPDGEQATARAAEACRTAMAVSMNANCSMEEVAATGARHLFLQLYVYKCASDGP